MAATAKMIAFAEKIAEELGLDEPDYNDFDDTSAFIDDWKDDYWESVNQRRGRRGY